MVIKALQSLLFIFLNLRSVLFYRSAPTILLMSIIINSDGNHDQRP